MLDLLLGIVYTLVKILGVLMLIEMFLLRLPLQIYKFRYYRKQGVRFTGHFIPILSSVFNFVRLMRRRPHVEYAPFYPLVREEFGENPPAFCGILSFYNVLLVINKP